MAHSTFLTHFFHQVVLYTIYDISIAAWEPIPSSRGTIVPLYQASASRGTTVVVITHFSSIWITVGVFERSKFLPSRASPVSLRQASLQRVPPWWLSQHSFFSPFSSSSSSLSLSTSFGRFKGHLYIESPRSEPKGQQQQQPQNKPITRQQQLRESAIKPACHQCSIIAPARPPTLNSLTSIGYRCNYFYPPDSFGQ